MWLLRPGNRVVAQTQRQGEAKTLGVRGCPETRSRPPVNHRLHATRVRAATHPWAPRLAQRQAAICECRASLTRRPVLARAIARGRGAWSSDTETAIARQGRAGPSVISRSSSSWPSMVWPQHSALAPCGSACARPVEPSASERSPSRSGYQEAKRRRFRLQNPQRQRCSLHQSTPAGGTCIGNSRYPCMFGVN